MGHNYTLFYAAKEGREDDLKWVLFKKKVNPNIRDKESGSTALHFVSDHGYTACAVLLLQAGARVNAKTYDGMTPLHLATYGGHVQCVLLLLQSKAEVNAKSRFGSSALHQAAYFGHYSCARTLLQWGACVNAQENWGLTPLMLACQKNDPEMVKLLLSYGASLTIREKVDGKSALHFACESESYDCAVALLDAGGDPNVADHGKRTPLHTVLCKGLSERISLLLVEYGANPYLEDSDGKSLMDLLEDEGVCRLMPVTHRDMLFAMLARYAGEPHSLASLCRHAIRRAMGPARTSRVHELPLPVVLQQYVSFGTSIPNQIDPVYWYFMT